MTSTCLFGVELPDRGPCPVCGAMDDNSCGKARLGPLPLNNITAVGAMMIKDAEIETLRKQADELERIRKIATSYPRCCDLWQDGLGGMHCTACGQKTFAMMRKIQKVLGVGKGCAPKGGMAND